MGIGSGEANGRAHGYQGRRECKGKTTCGNGSQTLLRPATPEAAALELHRRHLHKVAGHLLLLRSPCACPGPNAISPFFETGFARLEYLSNGHFNLAYARHTGEWLQVRRDMTLAGALEAIRTEPTFHP